MFEKIDIKKEEECEECGHSSVLYDAIYNSRIVRLCNRCLENSDAVLLKGPSDVKVEDVRRRSVSEILTSMSGVSPKPLNVPASEVSLSDLHERYREIRERRKLLEEQKKEQEQTEEIKEQKQEEITEKPMDFSAESTRRTRIRDILDRMKKQDEEEPPEQEQELE